MIQTGTFRGHKQVREKHLCMVRKLPLLSWTFSEVTETMATSECSQCIVHFQSETIKDKLNLFKKS